MTIDTAWNGGRRSKDVGAKRALLRRIVTETSQRYGIDGKLKTGARAPKPVTLATIKFRDDVDDGR